MKRLFLIALFLFVFSVSADSTEAAVLWLKGNRVAGRADRLWREKKFDQALNSYDEALALTKRVSVLDAEFYPQIVKNAVKRLQNRRLVCADLASPLDKLTFEQLKQLVKRQRSQLADLLPVSVQKENGKPTDDSFFIKMKALEDQVQDLKYALTSSVLARADDKRLEKQRLSLEAETAACMLVTHNVLTEYQNYSKDVTDLKARLRVISTKNQELEQKLERSGDAKLIETLQKNLKALRQHNKRLLVDKRSLTHKYKLSENSLKAVQKAEGVSDKWRELYRGQLGIYQAEITRLNGMLDVIQVANKELRLEKADLTELIDKVVKKGDEVGFAKSSEEDLIKKLRQKNVGLKNEVEEFKSICGSLKEKIGKEALDIAAEQSCPVVSQRQLNDLKQELQLAKEELVRQKALNQLLQMAEEGKKNELIELIVRHFSDDKTGKSRK